MAGDALLSLPRQRATAISEPGVLVGRGGTPEADQKQYCVVREIDLPAVRVHSERPIQAQDTASYVQNALLDECGVSLPQSIICYGAEHAGENTVAEQPEGLCQQDFIQVRPRFHEIADESA